MTLRRGGPAAPETYPQNRPGGEEISTTAGRGPAAPGGVDERRQREYELAQALASARQLQFRLELLGDRSADVAVVHSLRDSLARDLEALSRWPEVADGD